MRASEVRAAIGAAIVAITPDVRHGALDTFRQLESPRDPEATASRVFRVSLVEVPITDDQINTCDMKRGTWQVSVYYPWTPDLDDRIANDAERIEAALSEDALVARDADFTHVAVTPAGVDEQAALVTARYAVLVHYRCSEVLS